MRVGDTVALLGNVDHAKQGHQHFSHASMCIKPVALPDISYGLCCVKSCRIVGDLANGICVKHWDRGLNKYDITLSEDIIS
jgi:hypothetical protein